MATPEIKNILEAEFVQLVQSGRLERIGEAFESFSIHVIDFIHRPLHWTKKHHCLARLNAIFRVHSNRTECGETKIYLSLAISLVKTMKELVIEAQKKCTDAINSLRAGITLPDGTEIKWTGGKGNLYELINALQIKKCFNNGNVDTNILVPYFASVFHADINIEGCYEAKRTMKQRVGKGERLYNRRNMLPSRSYFCDDLSDSLNDNLVVQEKNDGRACKI